MPSSTRSRCRGWLAAVSLAALAGGCVHVPSDSDGAAPDGTAPDGVTQSTAQGPVHPEAAFTAPERSAAESAITSTAPEELAALSGERRGLGLVLPPSAPLSSIDGLSRPWDVPDIPPALKQDPYRSADQQGMASWYGGQFHGRKTANGERFDKEGLTAAHKTLPFGTQVCVRSMVTGKAVVVRINDRGPYAGDRIIDLSQGAAQELGMLGLGIKPVELWTLDDDDDDCPSFVLAGRRGSGALAGDAAPRSHQAAKAAAHPGRVRAVVPAAKARAKPAKAAPAARRKK
ncbi:MULTISPECIES: septal ring lytic transglycosylase RlpA family protein [Comamonas]|uniref:Endolytic peptidoglycan transglycosylase RlpA n=1 Tax=Comamonas squillarum TaxID=2977320 RepID=A0ABY5ZYW6_9BURK|nr:septal ring lytic transglycosylase RlpA family protein [Comamonas sp. PR12]UXC17930.1 septal ring lytic transglycosylase RlpA family protein [Comamonas sp. PR12]